MKLARSFAHFIAGAIVLAALVAAWAIIVDERCSRAVSELDPTNEEMLETWRSK